jgi:hypothetical protein
MSEKRRYSLFPKPLAGCVESLTRPVFRERAGAAARLLTHWPEIVGERLASHCYPEEISRRSGKQGNSTLTIAVESGYAIEIQYMNAIMLERIHSFLGDRSVSQIIISHSYASMAKKPNKQQKKQGSPIKSAMLIEDEELSMALTSLAQTLSDNKS